MKTTRRTFVQASVAGAVGLVGGTVAAEESVSSERAAGGWIDAHVHVWSDDTERYPISTCFKKGDVPLIVKTLDGLSGENVGY